jgi:hypothetical protein
MDQPALTTQKIRPGDGSERDAEVARVRQALLSAARRNDLDSVVRYFAPQIRCYDETMTASVCAARLSADPDQAREFFWSLQFALEIGTAFDREMIVAPYVAVAQDIITSLPPILGFYFVVAADRVRARSAPSSRAPVVEVLSYDIVTKVEANAYATPGTGSDAYDHWVQIVTPTKREAWICGKYLASPLEDTRFVFQRQPDGKWRLTDVYVPDI